jgi:hypothetical protein
MENNNDIEFLFKLKDDILGLLGEEGKAYPLVKDQKVFQNVAVYVTKGEVKAKLWFGDIFMTEQTSELMCFYARQYECSLYVLPLSYDAINIDEIHVKELKKNCKLKYEFGKEEPK